MSEMRATYIPCASGNNAQTDCLFQIHGSLIEVIGHPIMHFCPDEARQAAQTLWTMADSIEGRKAPRGDTEAVLSLIVAADEMVRDATREAAPVAHGDHGSDR
jgi:hypothetical protein